jgi:acyl-coenzyme A synthetase/AMP-(fatty) acid ligase
MVLYSGDLFKMDQDGYLYFVGRKDDMIKSRGERISPKEIEQCLCSLEEVVEAAVLGVSDEILGQSIVAYISTHDGHKLTEKQVQKHCRFNLEDFMVPQAVHFLENLPKTANEKIDKLALKSLG